MRITGGCGDECARGGQREMGADRVDALPFLDEDEALKDPIALSLSKGFDIDMAMMRQTPRLAPRPHAMLGAERDHALAMFGDQDDVAGDEDHNSARPPSSQLTSLPLHIT